MGLGVGTLLIAVGAVLAFAFHTAVGSGIDLNAIGYILMVAGALGIVFSLIFWSSWSGPERGTPGAPWGGGYYQEPPL
ncbi:MAG: hypothetical protein JOZ75_04420 [Candidatus Dormibacteraeota bacterium]|nr:hypothetical protein [Candidatus Dormibacteraeota bacterium]